MDHVMNLLFDKNFLIMLFVGILVGMNRLKAVDFLSLTVVLYLTSLAGITTGLFFSALVNSTEKAMSVLPLILIPQLLLSGYLKPLNDVYVFAQSQKPASHAQFVDYEATKDQKPPPPKEPVVTLTSKGPPGSILILQNLRDRIFGLAVALTENAASASLK